MDIFGEAQLEFFLGGNLRNYSSAPEIKFCNLNPSIFHLSN